MEIDIRMKQDTPTVIRYSINHCTVNKSINYDSIISIFDHDGDFIKIVDEEDCNNLLEALKHAKELGWF